MWVLPENPAKFAVYLVFASPVAALLWQTGLARMEDEDLYAEVRSTPQPAHAPASPACLTHMFQRSALAQLYGDAPPEDEAPAAPARPEQQPGAAWQSPDNVLLDSLADQRNASGRVECALHISSARPPPCNSVSPFIGGQMHGGC